MNKEDIIRMAKENGFADWEATAYANELERFAAIVASFEREACAKICDNFSDTDSYDGGITTEYHAILIRARNKE